MTHDRISDYLHDRAAAIELPPASSATVVRRARRRRARRGAALGAAVIIVVASGVAVTRGDGGDSPEVSVASTAVVPTALDWSVVQPTTGLGTLVPPIYAATDDGTVYGLSTAPGVPDPPAGLPAPRALYRSADGGADWTPVDLPDDFWAGSVASGGSQLYAVGTSPAGGGVEYRLATSGDGGATWSSTSLPAEVEALLASHPGSTVASQPSVAVRGDTVVVSASVAFNLDVRSLIPGIAPEQAVRLTDEGAVVGPWDCADVTVFEAPDSAAPTEPGDVPTTVTAPPSPPSPPSTAPTPGCADDADSASRTYTWAELGVDDEVRDLALAGGGTFVFVSHAGGEFTPVDVATGGHSSRVLAGDGGFTLLLTRSSEMTFVTEVLTSPDGVTWSGADELQGMVHSAGVAGGRAAVATSDEHLRVTLHLAQPDGGWLVVDPTDAIEDADVMAVEQVAFGPLGWAATVRSSADGEMDQTVQAVHSLDGTTMSLVPLDDVIDVPSRVSLHPAVSADAVLVRVKDLDQDPAQVEPRVVVGTPAD